MSEVKHQDVVWLAGLTFVSREFLKVADEKGIEAVFEMCPYGDLTDTEKMAFKAAFNNSKLRAIVEQWWQTYDEQRTLEAVPKASEPWHPF